jgi:DNA-binding HxlR family transcriptional regulator
MESSNPLRDALWPIRLGQLARIVPGASKKMLTQNLRKLEADGIVVRKDLTDLVLHIEYELDESEREGVCAILDHLETWGILHLGKSRDDKE